MKNILEKETRKGTIQKILTEIKQSQKKVHLSRRVPKKTLEKS